MVPLAQNSNWLITSAVLRLECSIDCISGSVTNKIFFVHFLTVSISLVEEKSSQKFN